MMIRISPSQTCVGQVVRCAEHLEAAQHDPQRLVDAVRAAHLALMAAMVEALAGTAGVGAFPDRLAGDHLAYLHGERPDMPGERTLSFGQLLDRMQLPGRLDFAPPLTLSPIQAKALAELDRLRGLIDHPKPTHWSVEAGYILRVLQAIPAVLEHCVTAMSHHYLGQSGDAVADGLARIRSATADPERLARSRALPFG